VKGKELAEAIPGGENKALVPGQMSGRQAPALRINVVSGFIPGKGSVTLRSVLAKRGSLIMRQALKWVY